MILPIAVTGAAGPVGVVVIGVNPYRPVDDGYLEFAELAARQFGIIVGDALTLRQELSRRRALADADQAKTQFLQQVSHELRSPLTLLLPPLIDLLSDPPEPLGPQSRTAVEAAVRGGRRLQRMVDALLDVARTDAGALDPDPVPIDLAAATAQVAAAFGDAATGAGLTLTVDRPAEPVTALVDPTMWTTIVTNLIDNAIKYTGRGGITLTVARAATGEPEVRVADTGAGIDPEDQERVFDRFQRADTRRPGAGLGLALVKDLTEANGGHVRLTSSPGRGSTFTITLPGPDADGRPPITGPTSTPTERSDLPMSDLPAPADQSPPAEPTGTLLLVEDDADLARYLSGLFRRDRWAVRHAVDAETADRMLHPPGDADPLPPDVVVTDVMLPGMNGLDLVRALRQDPALTRVPILVLTARADADAAVDAMAAGADDYLSKPFNSRELLARVRTHHELNSIRETAIGTAESTATHLRRALITNRMIATAIGIVMARYQIDARRARQALTRISQNQNRKLRDVAADVIDTGQLPAE